jgi:hypothetical protein
MSIAFKFGHTGGKAMDIVYLGMLAALFIISWIFVKLVERV